MTSPFHSTHFPRSIIPAPALAGLALLALMLVILFLGSAPAEAQLDNVYLKNTGQADGGFNALDSSAGYKRAQAFTTGPNPAGYSLSSIGIKFDQIGNVNTATSTATVNKASGSNPGNTVCTLTPPTTYTSSSVNTYGASNCPTLNADTTYYFVLERTDRTSSVFQIDRTASASEDSGGHAGWSIGNSRHYFPSGAWSTIANNAHQIEVKGTIPKPVTVWSTTMTAGLSGVAASGFNSGTPTFGSLATATFTDGETEFFVFQSTEKSAVLMGSRFGCNRT